MIVTVCIPQSFLYQHFLFPCSFLSGRSHSTLGLATHSRSHSDVSTFKSKYNSHPVSIQMEDKNSTSSTDRHYKSHLDLSFDQEKPLTLFEQVQLRKLQSNSGDVMTNEFSRKTKVFRQDSGLGTLSTVS